MIFQERDGLNIRRMSKVFYAGMALFSLTLSSMAPVHAQDETTEPSAPAASSKAQKASSASQQKAKDGKTRTYPDGSPIVKSKAAILVDPRSGAVLWEKNSKERLPIASLTKVMTALLILESGKLEETVTASKNANETPYSSIYLAIGEKVKLKDLLWGIMLRSGNDACVAAAEHLYGSVPNFVERMNNRALELGLTDTHFVTVNGLHDPNHYSTASDMAKVTLEALKYPLFAEMVGTKRHSIKRSIRKMNALFNNRSRILYKWDLADGVKTGYTKQAGVCFIGSATKDGWRLVSVVLKSPQVWDDTRNLLEYGFNDFQSVKLASAGQVLGSIPVKGGKDKTVPVGVKQDLYGVVSRDGSSGFSRPSLVPSFEEGAAAPLVKGTKIAKAYWDKGSVSKAASAELVALSAVEEAPLRVATRTMWWPLGLALFTFGALKYGRLGARSKNHRKPRRRVAAGGRGLDQRRTRVSQRPAGHARRSSGPPKR